MQGFRFSLVLSSLLLTTPGTIVAADATAPVQSQAVGQRGNIDSLVCQGNTTFSDGDIRHALLRDFDLIVAAHPDAPWAEYQAMLARKIIAGFRSHGFQDAHVAVCADRRSNKVIVKIEEGPRYNAGEVQVIGAHNISTKALVERLTKPFLSAEKTIVGTINGEIKTSIQSKPTDPVWEFGEPAQFPSPTRPKNETDDDRYLDVRGAHTKPTNSLEYAVAAALADQGYFFSRFSVDVLSDAKRKTAALKITIQEEGPRAVVGRIDVTGNVKNSAGAIIRYLELKPGQLFDKQQLLQMQQKLTATGRFLFAALNPLEPAAPGESVVLQIEVKELQCAPPLDKPLSPEEEALLKFGRWVGELDHWDGDMVVDVTTAEDRTSLVISPQRGIVATVEPQGRSSTAIKSYNYAIAFGQKMGIYSPPRKRKVETERLQRAFVPHIRIKCDVEEVKESPEVGVGGATAKSGGVKITQRDRLEFGIGSETAPSGDASSPFELDIKFTPAACLFMAHDPQNRICVLRGGELLIGDVEAAWRIDAATGHLLGADVKQPQGMWIRMEAGAYERKCKELREMARDYANDFDAQAPIKSFVGFLADEDQLWNFVQEMVSERGGSKGDCASMIALARRLLSSPITSVLDDSYDGLTCEASNFSLGDQGSEVLSLGSPESVAPRAIALMAIVDCNRIFPPYSWPWTVGRETILALLGEGKHTSIELEKVFNSTAGGPICFLTIGELLHLSDRSAAGAFASEGLRRLSVEDFRKDYQLLLDDHWAAARAVERTAVEFRNMSPSEVDELRKLFTGRGLAYFRAAEKELRADSKKPLKQALASFFDACWAVDLREQVKEQLEAIKADEPPPPNGVPKEEAKNSGEVKASPFGTTFFPEKP